MEKGNNVMWALLQVRPPVEHKFGCGPLQLGEKPASVKVFRHRLLQHFMLSIFCKLPVRNMSKIADLRHSFMVSPNPSYPLIFWSSMKAVKYQRYLT